VPPQVPPQGELTPVIDPTSRFLVTASGDRGWQGESTRVVLVHEVKWS
jgi:transcriptional activator SPT8